MKRHLWVILLFCGHVGLGQTTTKRPGLEQDVLSYQAKLVSEKISPQEIEFRVDTFRVEQAYCRSMKNVLSDFDMSEAAYELAHSYDSLMNKYYRKLAGLLSGKDRQVLVSAQKAWLAFRDNETKLVGVLSKEEYAGGGTIQRLTESNSYLELVKTRTVTLFEHYLRASQSY